MRRARALLALALLAGCHRPRADQPSPAADAQARTAARTLADIQAAEDASRGPPPSIAPPVHRDEGAPPSARREDTADESVPVDTVADPPADAADNDTGPR